MPKEPKEITTEIVDPFTTPIEQLKSENKIALTKQTILTPTNFSITGQRIFRVIASLIKDTDEPYKTYRFKMDEFNKVFGLKSNSKINYNIDKALNELGTRINLNIAKGRLTSWILTSQLYNNEVQVTIDPVLLPLYQMSMKKQYKLLNIKNFKNNHTFKFYEYFLLRAYEELDKTHKTITIIEMKISEIHEWLKLENKYNQYGDLKKRVILPMIKDINDEGNPENPCNIRVTYEELKTGRKVEALRFIVTKLEEPATEIESASEFVINDIFDNLSTHGQVAFNYFKDTIRVNVRTIEKSIEKYGEEIFLKIYNYIKTRPIEKRTGAYAGTCLRGGYYEEQPKKVEPIGDNEKEKLKQFFMADNKKENTVEDKTLEDYENMLIKEKSEKVEAYFDQLPEEEKEKVVDVVKINVINHYAYAAGMIKGKSYKELLESPAVKGLIKMGLIEELDNLEETRIDLVVPDYVLVAIEDAKNDPESFMGMVRDYLYENYPISYKKYSDISFEEFMTSDCKRHLFYKILELYIEKSI